MVRGVKGGGGSVCVCGGAEFVLILHLVSFMCDHFFSSPVSGLQCS